MKKGWYAKKPKYGERNPKWKGDDVGYHALHAWVVRQLGKPETCEHCGISGLEGKKIQWASKSKEYRRDVTDWIRLCVPCHLRYDGRVKIDTNKFSSIKQLREDGLSCRKIAKMFGVTHQRISQITRGLA